MNDHSSPSLLREEPKTYYPQSSTELYDILSGFYDELTKVGDKLWLYVNKNAKIKSWGADYLFEARELLLSILEVVSLRIVWPVGWFDHDLFLPTHFDYTDLVIYNAKSQMSRESAESEAFESFGLARSGAYEAAYSLLFCAFVHARQAVRLMMEVANLLGKVGL